MIEYGKKWFERAMTEPDINSRLVFLMTGIATAGAVVVLTVAFIFAKSKDVYPYMLGAAGGSGAAGAVGRFMTKKNGSPDDPR